jgi:hypothetical protein
MKKLLLTTLGLVAGMSAFTQVIVGTSPTDKNAILEELTGKTCQFCPDGHKIAQQIKDANPGRVAVLNIHTGGYAAGTPNYRSTWGDYVGGLFSVSGYPTGAVSRTDYGAGVMHNRSSWNSNTNTTLAQASPVNVGATATIDLDTRQISVDVEAYYTSAGPGSANRINVVIMQNNIAGPQTGGSTYNPAQMLPNGDYNHMHMVRHTLTPNAGDNIASISATSLYTNNYSYTAPTQINNILVNLPDLEIVVYVSEGTSTGKVITGDYATLSFNTSSPLGAANTVAEMDATLGSVCGTTVDATMQITNMGNTPLSTATIQYVVNGGAPSSYQHTFTPAIQTGQYESVLISGISGLTPGGATSNIDLSVTMLNGSSNPGSNTSNGHSVSTSSTVSANSSSGVVSITTDRYASETTWELYDETAGSSVATGGPWSNLGANGTTVQSPVNVNLIDGNCYRFVINDTYGDGICCAYGSGTYSFVVGNTTIASGGNFNSIDGEKFVLDVTVGIENVISKNGVAIYPNPTNSTSTISFNLTESASVSMEVYNTMGSLVFSNRTKTMNAGSQELLFDGTNLSNGIYIVNLMIGDDLITKKISLLK